MARYRAGAIGRTGRGNWGMGWTRRSLGCPGWSSWRWRTMIRTGCARRVNGRERRSLYGDYREMLERERLDFVAVCPRWLGARTEMVIAAAEAGVRGIFCEKPFAGTLAEADAMLEACERSGTRVAVAHRRANPYEQRAKAMVGGGGHRGAAVAPGHGEVRPPFRGGGPDGAGDAHDGQHEVRGGLGRGLGERACDAGRAGRDGRAMYGRGPRRSG